MSNGSPPSTIEGYPMFITGRTALVPPFQAAYTYQPNVPGGLIPAVTPPPDDIEGFPPLTTSGVAVAPDGGIWQYQPNVPSGMFEAIPFLQPPTNVTPPNLTIVTGGGAVGSVIASGVGTWTPSPPAPTFSRQWYSGGNPIPGSTGTTYTATAADVGNMITMTVVATNASGSSAPALSNAVGPITEPAEEEPPDGETEEARLDDNGGAQSRSVNETPKPKAKPKAKTHKRRG